MKIKKKKNRKNKYFYEIKAYYYLQFKQYKIIFNLNTLNITINCTF